MEKFVVGGLSAALLGLLAICFKKLKAKKEVKNRLSILCGGIVVTLIISIIVQLTLQDSSGWVLIVFYLILYSWRIIMDIIALVKNKFKPEPTDNETNNKENQ